MRKQLAFFVNILQIATEYELEDQQSSALSGDVSIFSWTKSGVNFKVEVY